VKGRQQGCSTWAAARIFHKISTSLGKKCFILANTDDAAKNIFGMVKNYYNNMPDDFKPPLSVNSATKMVIADTGSGYAIGSSGNQNVGRSGAYQYLHGTEVAMWQNGSYISAGLFQTIPEGEGTEIILESTANGMGNLYHKMCMDALKGLNGYRLVFIPWFWQDEYRTQGEFTMTLDEVELAERFGLDKEQILWRRNKIASMDRGEPHFRQEFPCTVAEAFEASADGAFIVPEAVQKARHTITPAWLTAHNPAPVVIGVDPAGDGKDAMGVSIRQGRIVYKSYEVPKSEVIQTATMQLVGHILGLIADYKPKAIFIDTIGVGKGVCDRLIELGFGDLIIPVNAAIKEGAESKYLNARARCWGIMRDWFDDEPCIVPDSDVLQQELCGFQWFYTSNRQIQIEAKDSKRRKELRLASPALADSLSYTFYQPLSEEVRGLEHIRPTNRSRNPDVVKY